MPLITEIHDLKRLYKRRVPKMFYDYAETGSWSEQTFAENSSDFQKLYFRQRVARDMSDPQTKSTMLGQEVAMPLALAPVGLTGMQCANGEIKAALAARDFGVPFCLSTFSICSIEDIAEHTNAPFWLQVYTLKDNDYMQRLMDRAKAAGVSAVTITLDLQLMGQRHKDLKNGLSAPPKMTLKTLANLTTKWRWGLGMLGTRRRSFGNVIGHIDGINTTGGFGEWATRALDESLDWKRVAQLMKMWGGPVILKGIQDVQDAKRAIKLGADAIIVSNHGGRQLDGALSSIRSLPAIMDAVGDKIEVHLDSGIRSGQDALKAIAMGAKGVHIGRAFIYGLGAMGQKGVTKALDVIHKEMRDTMALCGERDITQMNRNHLLVPRGFSGDWE